MGIFINSIKDLIVHCIKWQILQKSWVKLSRSLRSKTKSSRRTRNRRTKPRSEIGSKTMMKLLSRQMDLLTKETPEEDEEVKEATEASIVGEVVEAEEGLKAKKSQTIVGEDTTRNSTQKVIPPKTMVLLEDPTIEVKEATLKVNL